MSGEKVNKKYLASIADRQGILLILKIKKISQVKQFQKVFAICAFVVRENFSKLIILISQKKTFSVLLK